MGEITALASRTRRIWQHEYFVEPRFQSSKELLGSGGPILTEVNWCRKPRVVDARTTRFGYGIERKQINGQNSMLVAHPDIQVEARVFDLAVFVARGKWQPIQLGTAQAPKPRSDFAYGVIMDTAARQH